MIKVIDNFVNPAYYSAIEKNMQINFEWAWTPNISGGPIRDLDLDPKNLKLFGFSHMIFDSGTPMSPYYKFLLPLFLQASEEIDAKVLLKARGDMTVFSEEQITYEPHIDMPRHKEHINMILYIGPTSTYSQPIDGDTIIYKEKFFPQIPYVEPETVIPKTLTEEQRITPKANRLVIFSGEHWHTGQSPKKHSRRLILNLNFAKDDYRINR